MPSWPSSHWAVSDAHEPQGRRRARDSPPLPRGIGAGPVPPEMDQTKQQMACARQLRLAAHPSAVPRARRLLSQLLLEWELEAVADTALLLVSELVTNAVKASVPGGLGSGRADPVGLMVRLTDASLLLEVWDASPCPPVRQQPDLTAECGRGLFLVEALGARWGERAGEGGKVVWCEIALPPAPASAPSRPAAAAPFPTSSSPPSEPPALGSHGLGRGNERSPGPGPGPARPPVPPQLR